MKTYLISTINRLKRIGQTLDAKAILCGKKWIVFNDSNIKETYKFKEDGTVLVSVNGEGKYYNWKYDAVDKTIEIILGSSVFTYNTAFVDDVVFALQKDGTQEYAFLIDQDNREKFPPKTRQELLDFFYVKEQALLELENLKNEEAAENLRLMKAVAHVKQLILDNSELKRLKTKKTLVIAIYFILMMVVLSATIMIYNVNEIVLDKLFILIIAFCLFSTIFIYAYITTKFEGKVHKVVCNTVKALNIKDQKQKEDIILEIYDYYLDN